MKGKSLILAILVIPVIFAGCKKEKADYADESITVDNQPGLSIYKTGQDYFNFIAVRLDSNGIITSYPVYQLNDTRVVVADDNGNISYTRRWKLKSGYIVDKEMSYKDVFTNVTFQEQVDYPHYNEITGDWYKPRIIDKNPFIEYYHLQGLNCAPRSFTLGELNQMIENGTLETVFTRIR